MKITIPENKSEITLGQYQRYYTLTQKEDLDPYTFNRRKISIFTSLSFADTGRIKAVEFEEISAQIDKALQEDVEFINRFKINDIEFGFTPNLDKISIGEYVDLTEYKGDVLELHKTMSILFRPIVNNVLDSYEITEYNPEEINADVMKLMPLSIVDGALFFFTMLSIELQNYILKYTKAVQAKGKQVQNISKNGVGTLQ